jgi:hypothetical protein
MQLNMQTAVEMDTKIHGEDEEMYPLTLFTLNLVLNAACSFETLVSSYVTMPFHNPKDHRLNFI